MFSTLFCFLLALGVFWVCEVMRTGLWISEALSRRGKSSGFWNQSELEWTLAQLLTTCGSIGWRSEHLLSRRLQEGMRLDAQHAPRASTDQMLNCHDFPFSLLVSPGTCFSILAPLCPPAANVFIFLFCPLKKAFSLSQTCGLYFCHKSYVFALSFGSSQRCHTHLHYFSNLVQFPGRDGVCEKSAPSSMHISLSTHSHTFSLLK